jgi:hypothetical protein
MGSWLCIPLFADPFSMAPPKALENIGKTLHSQYERWQPKVRSLVSCLCGTFMVIFFTSSCSIGMALVGSLQASAGSNGGGS